MNMIKYFNGLVTINFNKYLNNFYNTGLDPFDYIQKEISYL